jgi:putative flippase GtrA
MTIHLVLWIKSAIRSSPFLRFLISGGLNTAVTYAIYLILLRHNSYTVSYSIAFAAGVIVSFALNRIFVFKTHRGWRSAILFPLVYISQYAVSLVVVWLWIAKFHLLKELAPLAFSKFVFVKAEKNPKTKINLY